MSQNKDATKNYNFRVNIFVKAICYVLNITL